MIILNLGYSQFVIIDDPNYPLGKFKPASGNQAKDGTPIRALLMNDIWGFLTALIVRAWDNLDGISGQPDNINQSDILDALVKVIGDVSNVGDMDERVQHNTENIASNLQLIGLNTGNINYLLQYVLGLVEKEPLTGGPYNRQGGAWVKAFDGNNLPGNSIEAFKFFSQKTIMLTNARIVDRRKRGWDIGVPYLSALSEVYHFDTDMNNQHQETNITIGYSGEPPALVGKEDFSGEIYFTPAVKEIAPYEMRGRSLHGNFSVTSAINAENATAEFWARLFDAQNIVILRFGSQLDELVLALGGLECKYHVPRENQTPYHIPREGGIPYHTQRSLGNTLTHNWQGGTESVNLEDEGIFIQSGIWHHIAAVATLTTISLFINNRKIDFNKNSQTAQDIIIEINEDVNEFNLDEFLIDANVALGFEVFASNTTNCIPYGKLNHEEKWFVLEAQDVEKVKTNLFETSQFLETYQSQQFREAVQSIINS